MSEGDVALTCMSTFVDALASLGLEHACVSPGSRSTPLALALWRHPTVRVHVHLDERSSAFFALGVAKATGMPVAVACTSGTAAANFLPAVVEASMSRVPLILLTADRPPELRGVGANQTIDQLELFGKYVRMFADARVPSERPDDGYWRERAREAVMAAMGIPPGPVHVNLPFREPLVPTGVARTPVTEGEQRWWELSKSDTDPREIARLADLLEATERGVVYAGGLRVATPAAVELARTLAWPAIAEPQSGLRGPGALSAGQFLLATESFADSNVPDLVLQFGGAPTSRAGLAFVASARRLVIVDPDDLVADPNRHAEWRIVAEAQAVALQVAERRLPRGGTGWLDAWEGADLLARATVDRTIDSWDEPFEGRIARDLAACLPNGSTLVVGSSMPVRDLDAYMLPRTGLRVLANRGASGIDGFVSTVLGVAASGVPTFALCGDLSLLHDVGSLLWNARRGYDAVFVVPNNDGGAIFSLLGQRSVPELEDLFVTPHGLGLARVAEAGGAGYRQVERADDLILAVEETSKAGGVWVVEVPSDREANMARHAEVHAAVAAALEGRP